MLPLRGAARLRLAAQARLLLALVVLGARGLAISWPPRCPRALALRGGMPLPHYVPARDEEAEREYAEMVTERCLAVEGRADEIKAEYPTAALSMALNGSVLVGQPLCVTREDFARQGIDSGVPQILPLGGVNHSRVRIMAGQEVTDMVRREAPHFPARPPLNLSDPEVQLLHQLPGYRPEGCEVTMSADNASEALGYWVCPEWLGEISDERRNRTYGDDWEHYMDLMHEGVLSLDTDKVGLEDYYDYMQALNKELLEAAEYGNVSGIRRLVALGAGDRSAEQTTPRTHALACLNLMRLSTPAHRC